MSASCSYARDHPFIFSNLAFDRKMQIGESLANANNVRLGALDANGMPLAVDDFSVFFRNEILYRI